jgi:hypothetical protein
MLKILSGLKSRPAQLLKCKVIKMENEQEPLEYIRQMKFTDRVEVKRHLSRKEIDDTNEQFSNLCIGTGKHDFDHMQFVYLNGECVGFMFSPYFSKRYYAQQLIDMVCIEYPEYRYYELAAIHDIETLAYAFIKSDNVVDVLEWVMYKKCAEKNGDHRITQEDS